MPVERALFAMPTEACRFDLRATGHYWQLRIRASKDYRWLVTAPVTLYEGLTPAEVLDVLDGALSGMKAAEVAHSDRRDPPGGASS